MDVAARREFVDEQDRTCLAILVYFGLGYVPVVIVPGGFEGQPAPVTNPDSFGTWKRDDASRKWSYVPAGKTCAGALPARHN